jgi:transcriptional regulator with XRE-family HTH domain
MTDEQRRPPHPLRDARQEQGLRLKDVADTAGVSISLVSTMEAGYLPPLHTREKVARALGASSGSFWPNGTAP